MKFKGIIFDLDGVIIHTDEFHFQAWKKIADKIEIPFDRKINDRLRGVSRMESLDIILENSQEVFSQTEKEVLADEKNILYRDYLASLSHKDVDVVVLKTLRELKELGYRMAIGSSSKNAEFILRNIKLYEIFDAISDGNNISKSKPDPEVFLKAAEFLMLKPSECVVVEDAHAGIDAAITGGFACFGIGDACKHNKVTWGINSFSEIKNYL